MLADRRFLTDWHLVSGCEGGYNRPVSLIPTSSFLVVIIVVSQFHHNCVFSSSSAAAVVDALRAVTVDVVLPLEFLGLEGAPCSNTLIGSPGGSN